MPSLVPSRRADGGALVDYLERCQQQRRWDERQIEGERDNVNAGVAQRHFDARRRPGAGPGVGQMAAPQIGDRLAADLNTGVGVVSVPTVRDADGLALSSRNANLTPEQRRAAPLQ